LKKGSSVQGTMLDGPGPDDNQGSPLDTNVTEVTL
jgi:hypothetical protein